MPSILKIMAETQKFKPKVLNLVINGMPSILLYTSIYSINNIRVLNLVINGMPSIHLEVWGISLEI